MLLEPWCTGSIISGLHPLGLEMEALNFGYDDDVDSDDILLGQQ